MFAMIFLFEKNQQMKKNLLYFTLLTISYNVSNIKHIIIFVKIVKVLYKKINAIFVLIFLYFNILGFGEYMCGIIGYCGHRAAVPLVMEGLSRLEYRGYDSAGIAYIQANKLEVIKAEGKIVKLEQKLAKNLNTLATTSIGHTRWATHGLPIEKNAHPHISQGKALALIHNGIIENFQEIKQKLISFNYEFQSETDTEVLANLIAYELDMLLEKEYGFKFAQNSENYIKQAQKEKNKFFPLLERAFCEALKKAEGAYAVVMLSPLLPEHIFAARLSAPLLLGMGQEENFVASDVTAFLAYTKEVIFLDDFEYAIISPKSYKIKSLESGLEIDKTIHHIAWDLQGAAKNGHKHFMLKEIMEQPKIMNDCLRGRILNDEALFPELDEFTVPKRLKIIACGTSYNAGLWAQNYFESLANIPVTVEIASEFRYRKPILSDDEIIIIISQSGETADSLGALRLCKELGHQVLGVCNVLGSSIARESDITLYTQAGPEISVASTKAMLSQMIILLMLSCYWGKRNENSENRSQSRQDLLKQLILLPEILENILPNLQEKAKDLAKKYNNAHSFFYLGRGVAYPLAMEGALKLKELSYIHAEAYALGEMKHGPIALIDEQFPSFITAFDDEHFTKVQSGILEIKARQGKVIALIEQGCQVNTDDIWVLPKTKLPEILALPAMQLFSYEVADYLGKDVDQPRNLAKSVTVE